MYTFKEKTEDETIEYDTLACSNRLLYVAQALKNQYEHTIDCRLLAKSINEIEHCLSCLPHPFTINELPTLKQCLLNLTIVNESLYAIENIEGKAAHASIFIDYVVMALHTEIDKIDSLL